MQLPGGHVSPLRLITLLLACTCCFYGTARAQKAPLTRPKSAASVALPESPPDAPAELPEPALAAEPPPPAEYSRLIDEALAEFTARSFEEARALFVRANEVLPNARALRGIGLAEFELKQYAASVRNLEAALASGERPLDDALRSSTQELLERARRYLGRIRVRAEPRETQLLVDGAPVALSAREPFLLSVGDHLLEFQAQGYGSERRSIRIAGGDEQNLDVRLERTSQPLKSPWLWTAVGVAAVGLGVTLAIVLAPEDRAKPGDAVTTRNSPAGGPIVLGLRY